jgi:rSAM/selenodomain-associated transferase 1
VPYGDQAQFIRTDVFDVVGGFPDEPLMEDVALMDRLKAAGHRITFLTPPARTSDRRWRAEGAVRGTLRNWRLLIAYRAGVPPSQLVLRYKPRPSDPGQLERRGARPDRTARGTGDMDRVIVFYRSLQPGRVKTRLAAAVGDQTAVAVYRAMVEDLVSELRDLWPNVVPYIDETGGEDLFGAGRPQTGSTLEERMDSAFSEVFAAGADRAVLVGSDIPGLHAGIIRDAFSVLDTNDAVVGPALNGGYYLIGYRRGEHRPALSRTTVRPGGGDLRNPFESVVQLLRSSGVSWGELGPLRDVDTVEDLELVLRSVADPRGRLHAAVLRHLPGLLPGH